MKPLKKVISLAVVAILLLSTLMLVAACDNYINFDNYTQNITKFERLSALNVPKKITEITFDSSVEIIDSTNEVLILKQNDTYFGYNWVSERYFAKNDNLTNLQYVSVSYGHPSESVAAYLLGKNNDNEIMYDTYGNKIISGKQISTEAVVVYNKDVPTCYLKLEITTTTGTKTKYVEVLSYYDLDYKHIKNTISTKTERFEAGEKFQSQLYTLRYYFNLPHSNDAFLRKTFIKEYNNKLVFFNKNYKEISRLILPSTAKNITYLGGKVLYNTFTPVDKTESSGYNYVEDETKYNCETFLFNISNGRTKKISTNYIITQGESFYNFRKKSFDLAIVKACPIVNGVAQSQQDEVTCIVTKNGKITESKYGMPQYKFGKNYLTTDNNIVNKSGKLVKELGDVSVAAALSSNRIALVKDGKFGVVDSNGNIKVEFEYTALVGSWDTYYISDKYALVEKDGIRYVWNCKTGEATSFTELTGAPQGSVVCGRFFLSVKKDDFCYDWYTLDGELIASNMTGSTFGQVSYDNKCGIGQGNRQIGDNWTQSETVYFKLAF